MLKKALICFGTAMAVLTLCLLLFVYKGGDEVTFFQRLNINQCFAEVPFEKDPGGNNILMPVAVASGTDGYPCDTFLGARNQIDYGTGCVELKVAVTQENEVVLAESFDSASAESVKLSRVIKQLESEYTDSRLVLELSEYGRLGYLNALLMGMEKTLDCYITGVNENVIGYIKEFFPQTKVLCDYSGENRLSLEEIKQSGADGILCSADAFNENLLKKARGLGLLVWVDCESDVYATVKAMKFLADGLITDRPVFVSSLRAEWTEASFKTAVEKTKSK